MTYSPGHHEGEPAQLPQDMTTVSAPVASICSFLISNPALWWITLGALIALAAAIYVPASVAVFRFSALAPEELALAAGAGIAGVA